MAAQTQKVNHAAGGITPLGTFTITPGTPQSILANTELSTTRYALQCRQIDISVSSIVPNLPAPGTVTATPSTTGGSLAAGTYYYKVTALNAQGQTTGSPEVSATTTTATSSVALSWTAVPGATSYNVYRGTAAGGENVYYNTTTASYTDTGAAGTSGTVPASNTAKVIDGEVYVNYGNFNGAGGGTPDTLATALIVQSGQVASLPAGSRTTDGMLDATQFYLDGSAACTVSVSLTDATS